MFSVFFINRPIFASVIAIVIVLVGAVSLSVLPISQYPEITPPTVAVRAVYPGANAQTISETVAAAIEQQVNGVEDMIYMSSNSANDGSYNLTVTFEVGTDVNMAQVLVQNRVGIAQAQLPEEVKRQGVTTLKKSPSILFMIALSSPDGRYDDLFLANYALLRINDELRRIPGVGDTTVFGGGDYSMRVWLDPTAMRARNVTTQDVIQAVQEQNAQVPAGQIGAQPAPPGQAFEYTVSVRGRLLTPKEFEDIIVRTDGPRIVRIRDVGRVELGAKVYVNFCELMGKPAAGIAIYQLPGSNALALAEAVNAKMEELKASFPEGLEFTIPYDTTKFVEASIEEVYHTLLEAAILVFLVIFLFLQDWRATLIPAITIPVSLIGTFAIMAMMGFSVNMLTLFGLVLAIGIVVDDAIVVVENVWHHMEHGGLSAREATVKAMGEITGPVIAITLVLMAVFLPTAFLPGITGQMYRQFAVTIAVSTALSALNALTLSPALCAILLRRPAERRFILFRLFNKAFAATEKGYMGVAGLFVRRAAIVMILYLGIVALTGKGFTTLPTGFLPEEDQGYCLIMAQLPTAASLERTRDVVKQMNAVLEKTPGLSSWVAIGGLSIIDSTNNSNMATIFASYKPWDERQSPEESQRAIIAHLRRELGQIQEAIVFPIIPPAINGLGAVGGFQMMLQDRGNAGIFPLAQLTQEIVLDGATQTGLVGLNTTFQPNVPQVFVDVDRVRAKTLGLPLTSVFNSLQTYLGSAYINDFTYLGRTYQVRAQAESQYRLKPEDILRLETRNAKGEMVPLGTIVDVKRMLGPQVITRYNMYPTASITGSNAPGFSSGQALLVMEDLVRSKIPDTMGFEWTGMSFQERQVGSEAIVIFALAVLLVLLVLSAQYESWTNPIAVVLVVPLALLGTVVAVFARNFDNNVYTQIGIVLIIALASKNAILIVEFAREQRAKGLPLREAALMAAKLRFRPILMTSFAFILGIVPLVRASGAAAASRQALGTAVFGGMIAATVLAVLFVPVFYVVFQGLSEKMARGKTASAPVSEK